MTIQQFQQLNEMEKIAAIVQHGHLLTQNAEGGARIFLYRFDSFYVAASYNQPDDQLREISCFGEADEQLSFHRRQLISVNPAERQDETSW